MDVKYFKRNCPVVTWCWVYSEEDEPFSVTRAAVIHPGSPGPPLHKCHCPVEREWVIYEEIWSIFTRLIKNFSTHNQWLCIFYFKCGDFLFFKGVQLFLAENAGWKLQVMCSESPLCLDASDQTWMCCLHRWNSWNISSLAWFKVFKVSPAECCKLNGTESTSLMLWLITVVYRVGSSGCKSNTQTLTGQCRTTSGRKGPRWAEALLIIIGAVTSFTAEDQECVATVNSWLLIRSGTQFDPNEKVLGCER